MSEPNPTQSLPPQEPGQDQPEQVRPRDTERELPRPGDEGGATVSVTLIKVHHPGLDADAEIKVKSLPLWEEFGWVKATDDKPDEGTVDSDV
jgi:hypothetical protein